MNVIGAKNWEIYHNSHNTRDSEQQKPFKVVISIDLNAPSSVKIKDKSFKTNYIFVHNHVFSNTMKTLYLKDLNLLYLNIHTFKHVYNIKMLLESKENVIFPWFSIQSGHKSTSEECAFWKSVFTRQYMTLTFD